MARSRGADPSAMTVLDAEDLATYLASADAARQPLLAAPMLVPMDKAIEPAAWEDE